VPDLSPEAWNGKELTMGKAFVLWLLGVPVSLLVILWLVGILR